MPAKIRRIVGVAQSDLQGDEPPYISLEFNKPLHPNGGSGGVIVFKKGRRTTKVRLLQDKNRDTVIDNNELIYKGRIPNETFDELTNNDITKVKLKKQMHSCDWDILKGKNVIACTADYVPELYTMTLFTKSQGKITPRGLGDFYNYELDGIQILDQSNSDPSPLY